MKFQSSDDAVHGVTVKAKRGCNFFVAHALLGKSKNLLTLFWSGFFTGRPGLLLRRVKYIGHRGFQNPKRFGSRMTTTPLNLLLQQQVLRSPGGTSMYKLTQAA